MESLGVEITYGTALFSATEDLGNTEEVNEELNEIAEIFKENPEFFELLKSPAVPNDEKKNVLAEIFSKQISETSLNFLYVLLDKRRAGGFFGMLKAFEKCKDEKKGVTSGIIYSAVEIPDAKIKKFEKETGALLQKNVELVNEIDTSLIGGIKVYIDGKLIDASIRRRLDDLKDQLI